jgi:hypothetical protein
MTELRTVRADSQAVKRTRVPPQPRSQLWLVHPATADIADALRGGLACTFDVRRCPKAVSIELAFRLPAGSANHAESSVSGAARLDAGTAHAARLARRTLSLVGTIHAVTACHDHSRRHCRAPFRTCSTALPRLERARTISPCCMHDSRPRHRRDFGGDLARGSALRGEPDIENEPSFTQRPTCDVDSRREYLDNLHRRDFAR